MYVLIFFTKVAKNLAADTITNVKTKILYTFGTVLYKVFILIRQYIHSTITDMKKL